MKLSRLRNCLLALLVCVSAFSSTVFAAPTNPNDPQVQLQVLRQQYTIEQQQFNQSTKTMQQWNGIVDQRFSTDAMQPVTQKELSQLALMIANTQASLGSLQIALADVKESIILISDNIDALQQNIQAQSARSTILPTLDKQLMAEQSLLALQHARFDLLKQRQKLTTQQLLILKNWQINLQDLFAAQQRDQQHQALNEKIVNLQIQQQPLLEQLGVVNQQLTKVISTSSSQHASLEMRALILQEKISLNRLELFLDQLQARVQPLMLDHDDTRSLSVLEYKREQCDDILSQLLPVEGVVKNKIAFVQTHLNFLQDPQQTNLLSAADFQQAQQNLQDLRTGYTEQLNALEILKTRLLTYQTQIREITKHSLSVRQTLPGLNATGWSVLGAAVMSMFALLTHWFSHFVLQVVQNFKLLTLGQWSLWLMCGVLLVGLYVGVRRYLNNFIQALGEVNRRFSQKVLWVVLNVVRANVGALVWLLLLVLFEVSFGIDVGLWFSLLVVYLCYRVAAVLARLFLLENAVNTSGQDVILYQSLRWILVAGGILTALTVLANQLPVAFEVRTLFDRLFMFVLLVFSWFLFRAWSFLPSLLEMIFAVKRVYIMRAIKLFCWVVPFTLLSNAVIGLVGYVQLAWVIGVCQLILLIILLLYMVARGLLVDFMELLYETTVRHVKNGWLWTQVFLKPLDHILRLGLFIGLLWVLVIAYNLNQSAAFMSVINKIFNTQLLALGDNSISLKVLLEIILFFAILYWFGKWSRELAYRWIYVKARDVGVRNSLSVFTQYAVVIIGILVGMRFLGIDLKGLAVVAAAFAAGIGFGLRDLVSNFFSGVLLLFERPFRAGDSITIGQYEGEVMSTGMRSMKIRTWDHMEVIVPNADMFTKPFINWTHQDSIVRTVVPIKIDRVDDPHRVQKIIYEVLEKCPGVIEEPHPEVFIKDISDSLVEFEVRYYINLYTERSRPRVRSEVLFAIWDAFKAHKIRPPYAHYEFHAGALEALSDEENGLPKE